MTTPQTITSGVLEAYLLGLTADEERNSVGQLIASSPELTAYLSNLDADLGDHFLYHSVPPPPAIRDVIELRTTEQRVRENGQNTYTKFNQGAPYSDSATKPNYIDIEVDNTHIRVHKNWRPAFIAVFVLSKVLLAASLYFYFKADSQAQEINRLKAEIHQTAGK